MDGVHEADTREARSEDLQGYVIEEPGPEDDRVPPPSGRLRGDRDGAASALEMQARAVPQRRDRAWSSPLCRT